MSTFKLLISALVAWLTGLAIVAVSLFLSNNAADFTPQDVMGFGLLLLPASAVLMLLVYLPGLLWLRRRQGLSRTLLFPLLSGVVLNIPVFAVLTFLIGRKMVASEALLFMLTFLIIGFAFGLGFLWSQRPQNV